MFDWGLQACLRYMKSKWEGVCLLVETWRSCCLGETEVGVEVMGLGS